MSKEEAVCRNCKHDEADHPNGFFCHVGPCRCPGWVKRTAFNSKRWVDWDDGHAGGLPHWCEEEAT